MQSQCRFVNEPLPYGYEAMEPHIDIQTMYLHHDKHLQTYINRLNELIDKCTALQSVTYEDDAKENCGFAALVRILKNLESLPSHVRTAVKDNAGGVFNHWFYFNGLSAEPKGKPQGELAEAIHWQFGGFEPFQRKFADEALAVFGSGYAWLVLDADGNLQIIKTLNQDTPIALGLAPVVCIDVWEHAYYLKHKNRRDLYLPDWSAAANWDWAQWCYKNPGAFGGSDFINAG